MTVDGSLRIFRVTVRGRFADLSDHARVYITEHAAEHDIFVSAYTPEGTLTYDADTLFFNMRYELRGHGHDAEAEVSLEALSASEDFLRTMRFGHGDLRATAVDMSAMWADTRGRDSTG